MLASMIESVQIRGFRSLADVGISELPQAAVFIGANGSGKSNFIRFFEMLSWMLRYRQLGEFIIRQGGADDQLFGGNAQTPRMNGEITNTNTEGLPHTSLRPHTLDVGTCGEYHHRSPRGGSS